MANKEKSLIRTQRINIPQATQDNEPSLENTPDIKDDSTNEQKVESSQYALLLDNFYDAILITNMQGKIIDANMRTLDLFNYTKKDILKLNVTILISGSDDKLLSEITRNLSANKFVIMDAFCKRKDKSLFPAEIATNKAFSTSDGELCFSIRDITTRKEMEEKIRQAHKIKSLHILAGSVAHKFNNLLTSVIGNTELALSMIPAKSKARQDLETALADANKMAAQSHRMRIYSGKGLLKQNKINISTIIHNAIIHASPEISEQINLQTNFSLQPVFINGEKDILVSMISNLLLNAIEAIGNNEGTITISISTETANNAFLRKHAIDPSLASPQYACIKIRDTGFGMDDVIKEEIFDPLFSTKGADRGLGLSEVQGIVLAYNGAIDVETEIGKGSTFIIHFPTFTKKTSIEAGTIPDIAINSSGKGILIIDDEESILRYSKRILNRHGFTTFTANNGINGINQFRAHADEIDLVVLDMVMPKMNGDKVLKKIREIRPRIKVLIASGYAESTFVEKLNIQDTSGFLYKPFATSDFIQTIANILQT